VYTFSFELEFIDKFAYLVLDWLMNIYTVCIKILIIFYLYTANTAKCSYQYQMPGFEDLYYGNMDIAKIT